MKKIILITALVVSPCFSDEKTEVQKKGGEEGAEHAEHDHVIKAPNGGRVLHETVPHAEFLVTKDRKIQITFLDDEGKPTEDEATVKAVGGKLTKPVKFTFVKTKFGFLSEERIPEEKMSRMILLFKNSDGKAAAPIRFNVDLSECPTCDFLEYACTCDHDDEHEGHEHSEHAKDEEPKK